MTDSVDFSSLLFPLLNVVRKANLSPFLGILSCHTLSSHKLTLTHDFKGALGSRGEKRAYIHSGPVPSRDEIELISRSVQPSPVRQQLEEYSPRE